MFHSRKFLVALRSVGNSEGAVAATMAHHVRHIPEEMIRELCAGIVEYTPIEEQAQKLADIVDLLHQQYDAVADPLIEADWHLLRDTIDTYAEELPLELIQYVMEQVVEHKSL